MKQFNESAKSRIEMKDTAIFAFGDGFPEKIVSGKVAITEIELHLFFEDKTETRVE